MSVVPQKTFGRNRTAGFWLCPWIRDSVVIDTANLEEYDRRYAGPDTFPEDCVLVVINHQTSERVRRDVMALPYPIGPAALAGVFIDAACRRDPTLYARLRWRRES